MFTVGSLFSGIGGIDLAAHWAGFSTSWFVEREPFCQKVLAKHWPTVPIHDDVFDCRNLPYVDLVVGGFPCQPFSVAGKRQGAKDERYLLPEMLRIVDEVKPYAVLFENVPGFPQINDGAEFKYLLRALAEVGFDAEWGHIRASDIGAPHQRERWFLVAYADGWYDYGRAKSNEWGANRSTLGSIELADPASLRREQHQPLTGSVSTGKGIGRVFHLAGGSQTVGNANNTERETRRTFGMGTGKPGKPFTRSGRRTIESGVRRVADGLPGWLDFPGFPARPGEDQHPYEPPRVTTIKQADRTNRLKALGNAVVPYQVYPVLAALHEWLTGLTVEDVA